eukprot:jgi/Bigna1/73610/fgenesh1_pg.25_\
MASVWWSSRPVTWAVFMVALAAYPVESAGTHSRKGRLEVHDFGSSNMSASSSVSAARKRRRDSDAELVHGVCNHFLFEERQSIISLQDSIKRLQKHIGEQAPSSSNSSESHKKELGELREELETRKTEESNFYTTENQMKLCLQSFETHENRKARDAHGKEKEVVCSKIVEFKMLIEKYKGGRRPLGSYGSDCWAISMSWWDEKITSFFGGAWENKKKEHKGPTVGLEIEFLALVHVPQGKNNAHAFTIQYDDKIFEKEDETNGKLEVSLDGCKTDYMCQLELRTDPLEQKDMKDYKNAINAFRAAKNAKSENLEGVLKVYNMIISKKEWRLKLTDLGKKLHYICRENCAKHKGDIQVNYAVPVEAMAHASFPPAIMTTFVLKDEMVVQHNDLKHIKEAVIEHFKSKGLPLYDEHVIGTVIYLYWILHGHAKSEIVVYNAYKKELKKQLAGAAAASVTADSVMSKAMGDIDPGRYKNIWKHLPKTPAEDVVRMLPFKSKLRMWALMDEEVLDFRAIAEALYPLLKNSKAEDVAYPHLQHPLDYEYPELLEEKWEEYKDNFLPTRALEVRYQGYRCKESSPTDGVGCQYFGFNVDNRITTQAALDVTNLLTTKDYLGHKILQPVYMDVHQSAHGGGVSEVAVVLESRVTQYLFNRLMLDTNHHPSVTQAFSQYASMALRPT